MNDSQVVLLKLRREYHQKICDQILGYRTERAEKLIVPGGGEILAYPTEDAESIVAEVSGKVKKKSVPVRILSNADKKVPAGIDLAQKMSDIIGLPLCAKPPDGQRAGALFTQFTMEFVQAVFEHLQHVRPGKWKFSTSQGRVGIGGYEQYRHLKQLDELAKKYRELETALGSDYFIKPDIVVSREPLSDDTLDQSKNFIERKANGLPSHTNLRASNLPPNTLLMHASISCKWTMRSDRSQNSRTEALNLMRNRKGRAPHIAVVTMEPAPSRLVSIAMGTGDVDCTYHAALHELMKGAVATRHEDATDTLKAMVEGQRLKDISDLPFDLAI
jgi:hypothetical protein